MKLYILTILLCCGTAQAEWYRVASVPTYNTITAARADGEAEPVSIRIRNLEKIEYIQPDPEKILIGGKETISLAKSVLQGQVVWIENIQTEEGAYVADIYPSFEQVILAYKEKRIINGDNINAATKGKLKIIYKQMLTDLNLVPPSAGNEGQAQQAAKEARRKLHGIYMNTLSNIRSGDLKSSSPTDPASPPAKQYESSFQRAIFTGKAIVWFRDNGQYLEPRAQKIFVDLLQSFQKDANAAARYTQIRIEEMMENESLFRELFLNMANFERGKFTYKCLEWFKNRGQYLPVGVQNVFVDWLRIYQQTHGNESDFMKQRLQWMLDNNGLYQDFLELGN
ncbi:MAG: hypothetical protein KAH99_00800 [Verrucomicrobia bacterium]|nr:hypothetical protein [Verrucomicrobiota bacterium]